MKSSHRAAYEKLGDGVLSHAETQRAQSGMAALVAAADLPFESPAFSALILASSSLTVPILPLFYLPAQTVRILTHTHYRSTAYTSKHVKSS